MGDASLDMLASNGIVNFDVDAYVKGTKPRYAGNPSFNAGLPLDQDIGTYNMAHGYGPSYGISGGAHLSGEPSIDAFVSNAPEKHQLERKTISIPWLPVITGGIVAGTLVLAGSKIKSLFGNKEGKGLFARTKEKLSSVFSKGKEAGKSVAEKGKEAAETVKSKAKGVASETAKLGEAAKEKAPSVAESVTEKGKQVAAEAKAKLEEVTKEGGKVSEAKGKAQELFTKAKTWVEGLPRWAKIAGLGVAGLFGLYELYRSLTDRR